MRHLEVDTPRATVPLLSTCDGHVGTVARSVVQAINDRTNGGMLLIARCYLHHQFVIMSLTAHNSAHIENKVG